MKEKLTDIWLWAVALVVSLIMACTSDMAGKELLHSSYDHNFEYRLGQEIEIENFNLMYNVECASGFHFFRTRKEAEEYNG